MEAEAGKKPKEGAGAGKAETFGIFPSFVEPLKLRARSLFSFLSWFSTSGECARLKQSRKKPPSLPLPFHELVAS